MFDTKDPRSFDLQQVAHNIKTINYCLCDSFSGATLVSWPMLASVWPNWPIHISAISVQFRIPDFMETSRHKACLAMPHYNSECHHLLRPLYRVDSLDSDGSLLNQSCILAYNIQPTIIYLPGFTVGAGRQQTRIRGRIRKTRRQLARGPETTSQVRAVSCLTTLGTRDLRNIWPLHSALFAESYPNLTIFSSSLFCSGRHHHNWSRHRKFRSRFVSWLWGYRLIFPHSAWYSTIKQWMLHFPHCIIVKSSIQ